jgi:hypothetical protein
MQLVVLLEAERDAVPRDVDACVLVEEKCRLVFRRAATPDRVEPATAELVHILDGDHFAAPEMRSNAMRNRRPRPPERPNPVIL